MKRNGGVIKKKTKKVQSFEYFKGYKTANNIAVEGLAMWASTSRKIAKTDEARSVHSDSDIQVESPSPAAVSSSTTTTSAFSSSITTKSAFSSSTNPKSQTQEVTECESDPSTTSTTSNNSLPSGSKKDKTEMRQPRRRKREHKSRLRCDDLSCTPCGVTENCNTCYNCLNRVKLK